MKGWVYIITNKSMPELLKVGFSTKDPELRAEELHTTGVPHRYVVEYDVLVNESYQVEQKAHALLKAYHENKEWFRCDIATAIIAIRQAANDSIILETNKTNIELEIEKKNQEKIAWEKKREEQTQAWNQLLLEGKKTQEAERIAREKKLEEEKQARIKRELEQKQEAERQSRIKLELEQKQKREAEIQEKIKLVCEQRQRIDEETREVLEKSPVGAWGIVIAFFYSILLIINNKGGNVLEGIMLAVMLISINIWWRYEFGVKTSFGKTLTKKEARELRKQHGLPPDI